jgi:receptor protein-tyrosine kinase
MGLTDSDDQRHVTSRVEDYLRILRERLWVVLVCAAAALLVALGVSATTTPLYRASAELTYSKDNTSSLVLGLQVLGYDWDRDRSIATALAAVTRSSSIAEGVKTQLEEQESPGAHKSSGELVGMVSANSSPNSDLVSIVAVSTVPEEAAAVANAFADQFTVYRKNTARAWIAEARSIISEKLQTLDTDELELGTGQALQDQYASLNILEARQDGDFVLMRSAVVPAAPFTPQTTRDIVLGAVLGLVLGLGLAFLLEHLDRRIKNERNLEQVAGLPVLASVPVVGRNWRGPRRGLRATEAIGFGRDRARLLEAFRTLRSTLQYFNVDGSLQKILVTSGLPQEGKTVTTVNLGISLALSGRRVIILEADLRRPMVHEYLGLENETGLSSVLAGVSSLPGALQLVEMDPFVPPRSRKGENGPSALQPRQNLYCITSGPLPPNPSELLQSTRMSDIISELEHMADYILIDTPPLLPVADSMALAPNVDAVILTAKLRSTTRDEITQVRELLRRAGVRVIGIVAGGVKVGRSYYYKRGYYHGGYSYQ